jgi:glutamine amidotransferase
MGNLFSVKRACEYVGLFARITSDKKEILASDAAILPGVGAFGDAMANLRRLGLIGALKDFVESKRPFMAVCLGMQLLMGESEELGFYKGLNICDGNVVKFTPPNNNARNIKIPQIGWNRILKPEGGRKKWESSLLKYISDGEFMYFVHSYYVKPKDPGIVLSVTEYEGIRYCSSMLWKNIFACQFHPEKSASEGIKIYRNFSSVIQDMAER